MAGVVPDALADKSLAEIERIDLWQGNRQVPLAELFDVAGDPADLVIRIEGDCSSAHDLAADMQQGELHVVGYVGRHAGQGMRGGLLSISGDAGDWLGAAMRGGRIDVTGDAGNHVGGSLPAAKVGMRGGQIVVHGNCGTHAGERMRRGWITVVGDCGEWAGYQMRAGTLMVLGQCGPRVGSGMRRGTIALLGTAPTLLPTFRYACDFAPQALTLMLRDLAEQGLDVSSTSASYSLFNGDLLEGGRGELLVLLDPLS
ncbi:Formyltransferase/hydrolase complex Fhc subunit C [Aeoliella mucimassa]|uniref:Formyltransferase/hydrolase complex Fhc subunit C n=2 Tax=Aeoliella mucimassa TaxID=2527972 RepID=A0A518AI75_9BACT|nr:Formyltransferase/hydrolase complex Fhc subunit C [Aeoliella mucimassa]